MVSKIKKNKNLVYCSTNQSTKEKEKKKVKISL